MSNQKSVQKTVKKAVKSEEQKLRRKIDRKMKKNPQFKGVKLTQMPVDSSTAHYKEYGTPYNALNSSLRKLSKTDAALIAYAHTVSNPRTLEPFPVPVAAVPGASAAEARMFQIVLRGIAEANSLGYVYIGANADGWMPDPDGDGTTCTLYRYLNSGGGLVGNLVHYTVGNYAGGVKVGGATFDGSTYPPSEISPGFALPSGYSGWAGINGISLPDGWVPGLTTSHLYNNVSLELRARPIDVPLESSGELWAFNFRTMPGIAPYIAPFLFPSQGTTGETFARVTGFPSRYISRSSTAVANWPSNKWISTVAIPNTTCCYQQLRPVGSQSAQMSSVGNPLAYIIGRGLQPNQKVSFEVTYNYAIYGYVTNQVSSNPSSNIKVDSGRMATLVENGLSEKMTPKLMNDGAIHMGGTAGAVKAIQADGRMPETIKGVSQVLKASADVFEEVTGSSVADTILEGLGALGAMLL